MAGACDCPIGPNGAAEFWKITIGAVTNASCTDCGNIPGDYYVGDISGVNQARTICTLSGDSVQWCNLTGPTFKITKQQSGGLVTISVTIGGTGTSQWQIANVQDLFQAQTLTIISSASDCNWPSTIVVTPVTWRRRRLCADVGRLSARGV